MSKRAHWILAGILFFGALILIFNNYSDNTTVEESPYIDTSKPENEARKFILAVRDKDFNKAKNYCLDFKAKAAIELINVPADFKLDTRTFRSTEGRIWLRDSENTVVATLIMKTNSANDWKVAEVQISDA